ncbi:MerR family transcriptional regulator [Bacillus atrophaeus]|uniref:MerR family transcriptional regulator n=1 Tax=Bacillus atrophaeus TaxID=1452 RepID=UPI002E1DC3C5|nr:MerR family transcriptional regulator [Bacillus atrophaeus]MED4859771.1 MerR family transcriptional regulator [Bacillus atrophaeus]
MGRDLDGAETYRISELAALAGVTKRTVDYYTNLGLLTPARSCSNYRYYDENALKRLMFIVDCKQQRLALSDIKDRLENQFPSSTLKDDEIGILTSEINHMNQNISGILHRFERLQPEERDKLKSKLAPEKLTVLQSFLLLLS